MMRSLRRPIAIASASPGAAMSRSGTTGSRSRRAARPPSDHPADETPEEAHPAVPDGDVVDQRAHLAPVPEVPSDAHPDQPTHETPLEDPPQGLVGDAGPARVPAHHGRAGEEPDGDEQAVGPDHERPEVDPGNHGPGDVADHAGSCRGPLWDLRARGVKALCVRRLWSRARDLIRSAHGIHRTFTAPDDSGWELEVER